MKRIKSYYPATLTLDDEPVVVHIRRMTTLQIEEFEGRMKAFGYGFDGKPAKPVSETDEKELAKWIMSLVTDFVTVPSGQLEVEDESGAVTELRTGADLIAHYGGRVDFIPILIAYVWGENRLAEKQKVLYRKAAQDGIDAMMAPKIAPAPVQSEGQGESKPVVEEVN
jgi:hypothetical protein